MNTQLTQSDIAFGVAYGLLLYKFVTLIADLIISLTK